MAEQDLGAADLDALAAPAGRTLLAAVAALPEGTPPLEAAERLRRHHPATLVAAGLTLHGLRVRARAKLALADRLWLTRAGLEQASSDRTAALHAARYASCTRVGDLCSGIGADLLALARRHVVRAWDLDAAAVRAAELNLAEAGLDGTVVRADVRTAALDDLDAVFVDPARRSGAARLRAGDSEPPLSWCAALAARVEAVGVKAAPGLPAALVPPGWEAEFVSEGRGLKEALLWSPALAPEGAVRRATVLRPGGAAVSLVADPATPAPPQGAPGDGDFLLDPDPAVTRAGAVADLAAAHGARQLDPQVAFLTVPRPVATPFARCLAVAASLPWNLKALRAELRRLDIGAVDVRKRGSAVDVDDLHRRLRLDGGGRATVVLTRLADRPWALICV